MSGELNLLRPLGLSFGKFIFHVIASEQRERGNPAVFSTVDTKDLTLSERSDPSPENLTFALLKLIFNPLPFGEGNVS